MTTDDPGAPPPNVSPGAPPPPPSPRQEFSFLALVGGLALSLLVGAVTSIFSGLLGMATGYAVSAFLIGALPGALFILISRTVSKNGFSQGLLIGGSIIALIGGACGESMVDASFR